ncbi:hypothetical protein [Streptomyces tanashiensis]|uniref:Uncharacterized protein n=1 Tax=Streptomyces tanashiensis TaxID=67367 RepID=A0ABY6QRL4_9ACTN|nr:hypothetical protein [Streptomyces tanashiensis]UZX19728.1 hypothetical protein LDH80_02790 [Streptomyces tanashiensis]GGY18939.1 hypothetical protein GCM10010299_25840 [Streptomyces tanashiensis]
MDRDRILQHTVKLRAAVTDLALGDNIVSQWCHGLAEPHDPPPNHWINGYPYAVDTWLFGHLRGLLPVQAPSLASSERRHRPGGHSSSPSVMCSMSRSRTSPQRAGARCNQ